MPALPLFVILSVYAGDPGPLCEAVAQADAVVELGFASVGTYPAAHKRKRWEPPEEEVQKNVATGRVIAVAKGDPSLLGAAADLGWTGFSNLPSTWWERFFSGEPFASLAVLRRTEDGWVSVGWIEDAGLCHTSWCWEDLRAQLGQCLASEGLTLPPPADLSAFATAAPQAPTPHEAAPEPAARGHFCGCSGC